MPKNPEKRRQEIVDHLVGNCDCGAEPQFSKDDVEVLNKLSLEQLEAISGDSEEKETKVENKQEKPEEKPVENKKGEEKPVENGFDESKLPASVQEELQFARNMMQQKKDQLISKITENKECLFTKEELGSRSVDDLTKIASLVGNKSEEPEDEPHTPARLGGHNKPTGNREAVLEDVLDLPVMNFSRD